MSETEKFLENSCNMMGVNPALVQLAYPPIRVSEANQRYAEIIKMDYCGSVSELSAVTQYIHTEICLSNRKCEVAKTILGIAMAEMIFAIKPVYCMVSDSRSYFFSTSLARASSLVTGCFLSKAIALPP